MARAAAWLATAARALYGGRLNPEALRRPARPPAAAGSRVVMAGTALKRLMAEYKRE